MAKTQNIFFKSEEATVKHLINTYGSANFAASKITEALPYIRMTTIEEIKEVFTQSELFFIIEAVNGKKINGSYAIKESVISLLQAEYTLLKSKYENNIKIDWIIKVIQEEFTSAQLYFLFDFCFTYYRQNTSSLAEYVLILCK